MLLTVHVKAVQVKPALRILQPTAQIQQAQVRLLSQLLILHLKIYSTLSLPRCQIAVQALNVQIMLQAGMRASTISSSNAASESDPEAAVGLARISSQHRQMTGSFSTFCRDQQVSTSSAEDVMSRLAAPSTSQPGHTPQLDTTDAPRDSNPGPVSLSEPDSSLPEALPASEVDPSPEGPLSAGSGADTAADDASSAVSSSELEQADAESIQQPSVSLPEPELVGCVELSFSASTRQPRLLLTPPRVRKSNLPRPSLRVVFQ